MQLLSKGTSGDLQPKLLLKVGSTLNSDQVAQGFAPLSLENLQGWGFHNLSGPPPSTFVPRAPPFSSKSTGTDPGQTFRQFGPGFRLPAILQLPAVTIYFHSFSQSPAAAAAAAAYT